MARIEMVLPSMPPAGMEMVVARMTRGLVARGHDAGITCTEAEGALGAQLRAEGFAVRVVPTLGRTTILFPTALAAWFRERRPDVVHVHSGAWLKAARAARMAGVPRLIHTVHGLLDREPWHGPPMKRWAARYTDAVVAVSRPLHAYMQRRAWIPAGKLHVIPNGIDTRRFTPAGPRDVVRARFGLDADRPIVGHVARFAHVKNQSLLLRAFARARERVPGAFLALIGDGELRPALERQAAALDIRAHVGFFGLADDLPPIYRDFDVFVLCSFTEGTSMSILEAMASELPIVATDVGGNADLLDGGRGGLLVPSDDVDALAGALADVLLRDDLRRTLGRAARDRAVTHYDEDAVLTRYEALYDGSMEPVRTAALEDACAE